MEIQKWQTAQCLANDYQRSAQLLAERIQILQSFVSPHHVRVALLKRQRRELLKTARTLDATYRFFT